MIQTLVDTPIWSLALRRKSGALSIPEQQLTRILAELIRADTAQIIGPIRQELLSGIKRDDHFRSLRSHLRAFSDFSLDTEDYESAAQMNNHCRAKGISGTSVDFLICAVALRRNWQILTTDRDFAHYARLVPIRLFPR